MNDDSEDKITEWINSLFPQSNRLIAMSERMNVWREDPEEVAQSVADECVALLKKSVREDDLPLAHSVAQLAFYVTVRRVFADFRDDDDNK